MSGDGVLAGRLADAYAPMLSPTRIYSPAGADGSWHVSYSVVSPTAGNPRRRRHFDGEGER